MEMTQFQRNLIRMWDSLRETNKGKSKCMGVKCSLCPLNEIVCNTDDIIFNVEKGIEVVAQWAKDHPVITYVDKYKEVFGVEPKLNNGTYLCPRYLGFNEVKCESGAYCEHCKDKFWHSEYKEPKKEGE